ncbi:hypothetical protein D7B24_007110 [Verticillium nonalfalfae]|uniref:Zn(2)-C6 fungal-type domain-containing protein n=1 Tax=Verticillium nonalfalfae TaxID=1051616 RepID=A0A3M9Y8P3_9PEZI|nr:uncharacterized protein D7B24_007110 [Verticillium nonalfalfae]RNJ56621.1 hypothetical protein D7B24_007110 [Verticillium nonalfalfae]
MGISALELHPHLAAPDTPPELVSPSSSSYSSRPSPPADLQSWASTTTAPVSPPMSNYERSPAANGSSHVKAVDDHHRSRPEPLQAPLRQQLPSLSSLFGPPSSIRPLHSPISDRPSHYPATSPLDRPRVSSAHGDRPYQTSYFPSAGSPSISQPRTTYDARYDQERASLHALTRSLSGSDSSRSKETDHRTHDARTDSELGGRWSIHQEAARHEYSLGSRESHGALRSPHDRAPFQFTGVKDYGSSLRDQRPAPVPALAQPTVAASTVTSEGLPSKDGLGPKIWTGTHFLPRFVRAAEVPGEGPCYFYDDGSHCKTVIDGEAVNPHWGVTKAGKPRKRLAIACITCREKKIKCDPDFPRCVQCEKFGRVCKFKNAPRGGHNTSPSTPPAEPEDLRRHPHSASELVRPGSNSSASVSPRTTIRQASPEPPMSHKRMRLGFDSYSSTAADAPSMAHTPDTGKSNASWQHRPVIELPRIHEELLNRTWQPEPYASEHRIRH